MLEGGNSSLNNIAICQYFIKGYRLIVPMHTAHVITPSFKSVRCKGALNKYENYLSYHKKQFADTIALCPKWTLVDFYIDEGASAPNMETAPEWSRLLMDAMDGKVDLILTQKVSNVSKKMYEVTFCARMLARQNPPIGIYFISEDIFTLASYYQEDIKDLFFFPTPDWKVLPEETETGGKVDD